MGLLVCKLYVRMKEGGFGDNNDVESGDLVVIVVVVMVVMGKVHSAWGHYKVSVCFQMDIKLWLMSLNAPSLYLSLDMSVICSKLKTLGLLNWYSWCYIL